MKKQGLPLLYWLLFFGFLGWLVSMPLTRQLLEKPERLESSEITSHFNTAKVAKVDFQLETTTVYWEEHGAEGKPNKKFFARVAGSEQWKEIYELVKAKKIPFNTKDQPDNFWQSLILQVIYLGGFVLIWLFVLGRLGGGAGGAGGVFSMGKTRAKRYVDKSGRKTFADVAGCDEAKQELQEVVAFLKNPKSYARLGARIPRGVLLYGAPGTGKTLLAKAVAGEAGVNFLTSNGSEFVEMFVGVGASRVRDLFETARKSLPCVVFIDEIDAVGKKRGVAIGGGHDEREQTLDALLTELDGFNENSRIIVIAATNRPDILDEALIRPGRFDRQIQVPKPDRAGREQILKVHSQDKAIAPSVDFSAIAQDTAGMVGADLENVVNEAVILAGRKNKHQVEQEDFSEAVDKVSMGPARYSLKISAGEKRITAYHEAGHTIAALAWDSDPVHKVTIIPRGPALGFTKQLPEDDHHLYLENELVARVGVMVGGRMAEELKFHRPSTGAHNDFEKASDLLRKMVYEMGMLGGDLVVYKEKTDFFGNSTGLDASQRTRQRLEELVSRRLREICEKTREKLNQHWDKLETLANALMERETLQREEIEQIWKSA